MLVTFRCDAYADLTFLGDVAIALLQSMGHSGTIPSAIIAKDVPAALHALQESLTRQEDMSAPPSHEKIGLRQRAVPLIALLEAAVKQDKDVLWTSNVS